MWNTSQYYLFSNDLSFQQSRQYKTRDAVNAFVERPNISMPSYLHKHQQEHLSYYYSSSMVSLALELNSKGGMDADGSHAQRLPLDRRTRRAEPAKSHPFSSLFWKTWAGMGISTCGQRERGSGKGPEKGSFLQVISDAPWEEPRCEKIASLSQGPQVSVILQHFASWCRWEKALQGCSISSAPTLHGLC